MSEENKPRHFKLKVTSFDGTLFRLFFNSFVTPNIFENDEQLEVIEYSAYDQLKKENEQNIAALINQIKLRDDDIEQLKSKLKVARDSLTEIKLQGHSDMCITMKPVRPSYVCHAEIAEQALKEIES